MGNNAPRESAPECLVGCNNKFGDISGRIEPVVRQ